MTQIQDSRTSAGEFGVIVTCSDSDLHFAKGCIASVLHFMPDVPICVLFDGKLDINELGALADKVLILDKSTVRNDFLLKKSFGFGVTKMVAFWESPFERFLLIDADTCVWGDMRLGPPDLGFDMVVDEPLYRQDAKGINHWFFDTVKLSGFDPSFMTDKYSDRYFCTGVVYSRRNVFKLDWYEQLVDIERVQSGTFKFGEMGMLNYMIFKLVDSAQLTVCGRKIQYICPDFSLEETRGRFPIVAGLPVVAEARVLHFCGPAKPWSIRSNVYHDPVSYFRQLFYRTAFPGLSESVVRSTIRREDAWRLVANRLGGLRRRLQAFVRSIQ